MRLNVTVPVYNEEKKLVENILQLQHFLVEKFLIGEFSIIIAENGSTDKTPHIAKRLAEDNQHIIFFSTKKKGRGGALRESWERYPADIVGYMDADLSTDIKILPSMLVSLEHDSDITIGSRLKTGSRVTRSIKRELFSRSYNIFLKHILGTSISDAQCGFKFLRGEIASKLLKKIKNEEWFFDTEMLILAERSGVRIKEFPVEWKERVESTVNIPRYIAENIRGVFRLWKMS